MMRKAPLDTIDNDISNDSLDLYQKYRPLTWDDMIGQESTIKGLRRSVITGNLPAAYIFAGKHGCGKTTAAFILARALNCPNVDKRGNPCNVCESCKSISMNSNIMGFNYQAASNATNIDSVREIIKNAYIKSPMKKPVWILDEFQALQKSNGAYDEFLAPIENGVPTTFIFCTTEINKINKPALLSRCRKFTFGEVSMNEMIPFCVSIMHNEGYEIVKDGDSPTSDKYITRNQVINAVNYGGGSVRDTLSRLSAIVMSGEGQGESTINSIIVNVFGKRDIGQSIQCIEDASQRGEDINELTGLIADYIGKMIMMNNNVNNGNMVGNTMIRKIAKQYGSDTLAASMTIVGSALSDITWGSADARIYLEIAILKIISLLGGENKHGN